MADIRKIREEDIYGFLGCGDGLVQDLPEYDGLRPGDTLEEVGGVIEAIFGHHESGAYWCVVKIGEEYYEVDL